MSRWPRSTTGTCRRPSRTPGGWLEPGPPRRSPSTPGWCTSASVTGSALVGHPQRAVVRGLPRLRRRRARSWAPARARGPPGRPPPAAGPRLRRREAQPGAHVGIVLNLAAGLAGAARGRRTSPTASTRSATGVWLDAAGRRGVRRAACSRSPPRSPTPTWSAPATSTRSGAPRTGSASTTTPRSGRRARADREGGRSASEPARVPRASSGARPGVREPRTDIGWEVEPRGLEELLVETHRRTGPAAAGDRERRRVRRHPRSSTAGSTTQDRIAYLRGHLAAVERAREAGPTCAPTSSGRCWTTSSGPRATPRSSAWCTSTPRPGPHAQGVLRLAAPRRRAPLVAEQVAAPAQGRGAARAHPLTLPASRPRTK